MILPGCLLYILTSLLYFESPRFLIDNNFEQAESLMKKISEINKVKQENVTYILQRQFFWNKVNLQKYSVLTLFQFDSISSNTCSHRFMQMYSPYARFYLESYVGVPISSSMSKAGPALKCKIQ